MEIKQIVDKQREFFNGGATFSVDYRLDALKKLKQSILAHVDDLTVAFKADFNKCEFDVCSTEVGMVLQELNFCLKSKYKLKKQIRIKVLYQLHQYLRQNLNYKNFLCQKLA